MQNAYNITRANFVEPSVRPGIDIHSLDYDFPENRTRPVVRTNDSAIKRTVIPARPVAMQVASSSRSDTTAVSYKPPLSLPAAQERQPSAIVTRTITALSSKPTPSFTAETFADAVQSGCLDLVLYHIAAGLDVNAGLGLYGKTPLMHAAQYGHEAIVQQLLKAGANANQAMTNGWFALMFAATNGHTVIVQALLGGGATVDQTSCDGITALSGAACYGQVATVRSLLMAGANCKLKCMLRYTALDLAIHLGHKDVIKLLRTHEAATSPQSKSFIQHLFG